MLLLTNQFQTPVLDAGISVIKIAAGFLSLPFSIFKMFTCFFTFVTLSFTQLFSFSPLFFLPFFFFLLYFLLFFIVGGGGGIDWMNGLHVLIGMDIYGAPSPMSPRHNT